MDSGSHRLVIVNLPPRMQFLPAPRSLQLASLITEDSGTKQLYSVVP
jgi:hypothetical protein